MKNLQKFILLNPQKFVKEVPPSATSTFFGRYRRSIFADICRYVSKNVDIYMPILVDICRKMSKNVDICVDICRYMSKNVDFCGDFGRYMSKNFFLWRYMSKIVDFCRHFYRGKFLAMFTHILLFGVIGGVPPS